MKLISVLLFAYADCWFSHETAYIKDIFLVNMKTNTQVYGVSNVVVILSIMTSDAFDF